MSKYYPAISWYCLLAGYGRFSKPMTGPPINQNNLHKMNAFLRKTSQQFISHDQALQR